MCDRILVMSRGEIVASILPPIRPRADPRRRLPGNRRMTLHPTPGLHTALNLESSRFGPQAENQQRKHARTCAHLIAATPGPPADKPSQRLTRADETQRCQTLDPLRTRAQSIRPTARAAPVGVPPTRPSGGSMPPEAGPRR